PRFATGELRTANAVELEEVAEEIFRSRSAEEWDQVFLEHGLPGSTALTLEEAFVHPQAALDGMLKEVPTKRHGIVHVPGFPVLLSRSQTGRWTAPPGWDAA